MLSFSYQTLKDATPFPSPLSKTQPPQNGFHRNKRKEYLIKHGNGPCIIKNKIEYHKNGTMFSISYHSPKILIRLVQSKL